MRRLAVCLLALAAGSWSYGQTLDEGRSLHVAGRLDEALAVYRAVASHEADPAIRATALNNACVILKNTGDLRGARESCLEALLLRRQLDDSPRVARTLNNLGLVEQGLAEYAASRAHFLEALSTNEALGDFRRQALNHSNLGVLATQAGRYAEALASYERVTQLARAHDTADWSRGQLGLTRINRAVVFERLGAYREALELYRRSLDEQQEMSTQERAVLQMNLGVVYRNLGDPRLALRALEDAITAYEELGDLSALSNAYLNAGLVEQLNLARPAEAERAFREALRLARESGDRSEEIRDLHYLGRLLSDLGRHDEAEPLYASCLQLSEASGSVEGRWTALEGLGRVAAARGEPRHALERFGDAMTEIEKARGAIEQRSLRAGFFGDHRTVYAAAVSVLADLDRDEPEGGHGERAFELAQRAKARTLLDALGPGAERGNPLSAGSVAELVGTDLLLEYFVGEKRIYRWVVHDGRVGMTPLGPSKPILERVADAHDALAAGHTPTDSLLHDLSNDLLGGASLGLENVDLVRVAPDGPLHYLPYELLRPSDASPRALIESVTVSYLPSGSALGWLQRHGESAERSLLGIGDPVLATGGETTPTSLLAQRFDLGPLAAARDELAAIERMLPGAAAIRMGVLATETELRRLAAEGARVVHLASHTIVDERPGRGAAILLSPDDESDGLLYPDEIAGMSYPVDLTVLAACSTAIDPGGSADSLAALTGSFLAAGSSSVVATLWDVDDLATQAFMEQFYDQLRRGRSPAVALRNAKQRFLSDPQWSNPALWSAYILVGDAPSVVSRRARWWIPVLLMLATGAVLYLIVVRRRVRG